ncbi:EAL domain-containing protein [Permianibacter sp. IMCC34836]|uniref:putative bifunctional diguanylate cyclase/phosphodiesterase n=1 Tax=Permianibacter fluminis TaxID=2738515 RepID=UPI001556AD40|nr:EAL domain-containing protein [Permianibacter fluminis]NQD37551.1 EAL domain-containing protein [Permianibacter fluminis]
MEYAQHPLLPAVLQALREAVLVVDPQGQLLLVNRACRRLLGYRDDDRLEGALADLLLLVDENSREPISLPLERLDDSDWLRHINDSAVILRRNGSEFPFELTVSPVQHAGVSGWLLTVKDLFQTRSLADTIHFQRSHDSLTGLVNRAEFESRLQDALLQSVHDGSTHALCYLDLDQFKVVNDTCGHIAGDELLRQLTDLFRSATGDNDVLARIGGDEFAVLLWQRSLAEATTWAEQLRERVSQFPFSWGDKSFSVSISVGVAPLFGAGQNWATVLGQADAACYHAKDLGGNQVRVYSDDDVQLAQRHTEMQWVSRIVQALQQDRFQLWAQRIAPVLPGNGGGHQEILVRMVDVDGSLIPPGMFLPAAERFNLVLMLDRWVVGRTLDWMAQRQKKNQPPIRCAINLSGASINQSLFHQFVADELQRSGVTPSLVCFEVTETAAIANLQSARAFIQQMKQLGCAFALDDFGAGMSSFAYLRNLPVDYLKIDGVFVKDLANNAMDYAMVRAINEVGKVMGMQTIAEFVENDAVLAKLREIGVDYAQGYGIARPAPLPPA